MSLLYDARYKWVKNFSKIKELTWQQKYERFILDLNGQKDILFIPDQSNLIFLMFTIHKQYHTELFSEYTNEQKCYLILPFWENINKQNLLALSFLFSLWLYVWGSSQ